MRPAPSRRWSLALASAVCLLAACASPEERLAEYMANARSLAEKGETEKAILEYRSALKVDPESADANLELADLLLERGDDDALFYYGETYRVAPERLDVGMRLARLLLVRGETPRAREIVMEAVERAPDEAIVHAARSELALYEGDAKTAIEAAQRGIALAPESSDAWFQLGRAYQGHMRLTQVRDGEFSPDDVREAIAAFERADEVAGGSVQAQLERARVIAATGGKKGTKKAETAFYRAMTLANEKDEPVLRMMVAEAAADFALGAHDPSFHRWALNQIVDIDPERNDAWRKLVRLLDGQYGLGGLVFPRMLERRPDSVQAHLMYSRHLVRNGRPTQAAAHLQRQIARGLDSPLLVEELIRIQLQSGRLADARATYVALAEREPDALVTKRADARIAMAEGRFADAAKTLRTIAAEAQDAEVQRLLAVVELRQGNLPNATAAVDRAASLAPRFSADIARLKARIHHDASEWKLALRAFAVLQARHVELTREEKLMRARCLYETGASAAALKTLRPLLWGRAPLPDAAVEFAVREGSAHPEKAREYLEAAVASSPGHAGALEALTDLDVRQGRGAEALARLDGVIESRKGGPHALLLRARLLAAQGQLERAEADALLAFEADPGLPGAVDLLFSIYRAEGRIEEAQRSFEEADTAGVLHAGARLLLGRIYLDRGEDDKALATFERVVAEDPELPGAKHALALLLARRGEELDRALRLAEEAQQALSNDENAADTVGYVYLRKGLNEAALQQFRYAIELAQERPGGVPPAIYYHHGLALRALGRHDQAVHAFEKALSGKGEFRDAEDARRQLDASRAALSRAS